MPDNQMILEANPVRNPAGFEPQHGKDGTLGFERTMGRNGHVFMASKDGEISTIGATTDAESTTGNGTFIAILKRVRTLLTAVFEAIITPGAVIGTSKSIKVAGSDGTNVRDISTTSTGAVNVALTGSNMEYYGATVATRPAANAVPLGAVFMSVGTQEVWQSDGTNWVVV